MHAHSQTHTHNMYFQLKYIIMIISIANLILPSGLMRLIVCVTNEFNQGLPHIFKFGPEWILPTQIAPLF